MRRQSLRCLCSIDDGGEETKEEEMEELELLDRVLNEAEESTLDLLQERQIRNLDSMVAVMSMSVIIWLRLVSKSN